VPFQVYNPPYHVSVHCIDYIMLIYWTVDMILGFFNGYYQDGELVMKIRPMVHHYIKTWFPLDILVLAPDWFSSTSSGESNASSLGRLLRGSRILRVIRLLRIMKLQRMINNLYDLIDNEYSFMLAELLKLMIFVIGLNHIIACGWFWVGKSAHGLGMASWISWNENFLAMGIDYQYATSLHWSLTQFTPASMDVMARNIHERIYSIIVLLFAMVAFSSIVGTVTTSMTTIRQMKGDKAKQIWKLRRYLNQREVSADLQKRVIRFAEYQMSKLEKTIQEPNVFLLKQISEQLARELAHEMHAPFLNGHALFLYLMREITGIAWQICHYALNAKQVAAGDTLFLVGEEASLAFIIKSGGLTYTFPDGHTLEPPLAEREWLAEAVLWTHWRYRGTCKAGAPNEILALDAKCFMEAMFNHPKSISMSRLYGRRFIQHINIDIPSRFMDVLRDKEFSKLSAQELQEGPECEEQLLEEEE